MKPVISIVFALLIFNSVFSQDSILTRKINNFFLKIPVIKGFKMLDTTEGSTSNTLIFIYGEDLMKRIHLSYVPSLSEYLFSLKKFTTLKQRFIQDFQIEDVLKSKASLENALILLEQYFKDKPDSLELIKERSQDIKIGENVKVTYSNRSIFYNTDYGMMLSYDVTLHYLDYNYKVSYTTLTGMFLLKNNYFAFSGSIKEQNLVQSKKLENYVKQFGDNLIMLNKSQPD